MTVVSVNVPRQAAGPGVLRLEPAAGPVGVGLAGFARAAEGHPVGEDPAMAGELALSHALYAYSTLHLPVRLATQRYHPNKDSDLLKSCRSLSEIRRL